MYYKIVKGSETFRKLAEVKLKMDAAGKASDELVKKLKGKRYYKKGGYLVAGGIAGIEFLEKPENWKHVNGLDSGFYFPKSTKLNQSLIKEINNLPEVTIDEFNESIGFKEHTVGTTWFSSPGMHWEKDYMLLVISDKCEYTPPADVIEILTSEFKKLQK